MWGILEDEKTLAIRSWSVGVVHVPKLSKIDEVIVEDHSFDFIFSKLFKFTSFVEICRFQKCLLFEEIRQEKGVVINQTCHLPLDRKIQTIMMV